MMDCPVNSFISATALMYSIKFRVFQYNQKTMMQLYVYPAFPLMTIFRTTMLHTSVSHCCIISTIVQHQTCSWTTCCPAHINVLLLGHAQFSFNQVSKAGITL